MKVFCYPAAMLLAYALPLSLQAAEGGNPSDQLLLKRPAEISWQAEAAGVQRQIIHTGPGCRVVTLRARIPPNTDLPPHGHKQGYRIVTVISGTLQLGFGKTFDEKALQSLPPGSVFSEPAGHLHFARTGAEPVILQLTEVDGSKPDHEGCR